MNVVVIHILASLPIITGIIWLLLLYKRELENVESLSKLNTALHEEIKQLRRELMRKESEEENENENM